MTRQERILLLYPGFYRFEPNSRPPLGIGYIASMLQREGYNLQVLDLSLYEDPQKRFDQKMREFEPTTVAFSVLTTVYPSAKEYAKQCEEYHFVRNVILGGPHPTTTPETVLEELPNAILVRGEGEYTIAELMRTLKSDGDLQSIQGISYYDEGKVVHTPDRKIVMNLDELPFPALELMEVEKYGEKLDGKSIFSLVTSRGCPFKCVYCCKATHGRKWIGRSPGNIVAEIEHYIERWGRSAFYFVDDLFTCDEKRVNEFCELVNQRKLDIRWRCLARVDMVSEGMLRNMKSSGCTLIDFGIESCDDEVLEGIKKGYTYDKVEKALSWTKQIGVHTKAHMMLALPGDTAESMFRTVDRIIDLNPEYIQFNVTIPFPQTELWDIGLEHDIFSPDWEWNYFQMSTLDRMGMKSEEKEKIPIFLPENFTKEEVYELFYLANNIHLWYVYKDKFSDRKFRLLLSMGRHPVRFAKLFRALYRYSALKKKKLGEKAEKAVV